MTAHKLFITGGVGSRNEDEAFGEPYEMPSDVCYCETCAQIASFMWNWRMLLISGQRRYADLMERTLFNSIISGRSLDGLKTRYENPLMRRGYPPWGESTATSAKNGTTARAARPTSCAFCRRLGTTW